MVEPDERQRVGVETGETAATAGGLDTVSLVPRSTGSTTLGKVVEPDERQRVGVETR